MKGFIYSFEIDIFSLYFCVTINIMNKTLIFLAIFIVYTSLVYTQVALSRISGKIYDAETNEPIPAVTIRILAQNDSTL